MKKTTAVDTNSFIELATKIHNNLYDYKESIFINYKTKVKIFCITCNEFFYQTPRVHIYQKCGHKKCQQHKLKTTEKFIQQSNIIHNNKYSYFCSKYLGSIIEIDIFCPIHGIFSQRPEVHLAGKGCQKCGAAANLSNTKEFIIKATQIHNGFYSYEQVIYINSGLKIIIICPIHGEFQQTPHGHLQGHGCKFCNKFASKKETKWLDSLNIQNNLRNKSIRINKENRFNVDAIDEINKIIYEFYGDFWHGHPTRYNPDDINKVNKKSFSELYQKTLNKENILKEAGYQLITIWESDFDKLALI